MLPFQTRLCDSERKTKKDIHDRHNEITGEITS